MDLVEVRFRDSAGSGGAGEKAVFVEPGTTLLQAAEMAGVEILTGCTRGMCGTDAVQIALHGDAALAAPEDHEAGTLARMGVGDDCRLACSAKVLSGPVEVLGDALA